MIFSEDAVRSAIRNKELQVFYQPQYDAITAQIKSAEALVRWIQKDGTVIPPSAFVPQAEETDFIREIDWHIAEEVCQMLQKQGADKQFPVSVNFSRRHINEINFAEKLSVLVDSYNLPHSLIEVEITESAMVNEPEKILDWINAVRDAGFSVAIDDFGSGLSSLQFVKDMPADVLKIDKSLLSHNCENEKERIVLESIFYFAHRLHMTTIAEGVETKEQLAFLRTCDCGKIQGYIFAKPMPEADYLKLCRHHMWADEPADILEIQTPASASALLMRVVFKRYPLVIFSNLNRNSFYMMAYQDFSSTGCPSTGLFDELITHGASSMHPEDQERFAATFERHNLLKAYADGKSEVRLVTRQLGDDGCYRRVETTDYFVKSASSDDVLVITLCENLPDEE
ncbi:MAG: EAL domain-containing protein [Oscillospiraceae bacterium]|nr:EAL domain-containing protein [Oscillospiraceae bacterium]